MDFSTPGLPVHHQILELTQAHVHELVMPSNHLILCRPLLLLPSVFPSIRAFSNESVLPIRWPKYWSFSVNISPSNEYLGLISSRMDWLDLLSPRDSQESSPTPQFKSINSLARAQQSLQWFLSRGGFAISGDRFGCYNAEAAVWGSAATWCGEAGDAWTVLQCSDLRSTSTEVGKPAVGGGEDGARPPLIARGRKLTSCYTVSIWTLKTLLIPNATVPLNHLKTLFQIVDCSQNALPFSIQPWDWPFSAGI